MLILWTNYDSLSYHSTHPQHSAIRNSFNFYDVFNLDKSDPTL